MERAMRRLLALLSSLPPTRHSLCRTHPAKGAIPSQSAPHKTGPPHGWTIMRQAALKDGQNHCSEHIRKSQTALTTQPAKSSFLHTLKKPTSLRFVVTRSAFTLTFILFPKVISPSTNPKTAETTMHGAYICTCFNWKPCMMRLRSTSPLTPGMLPLQVYCHMM